MFEPIAALSMATPLTASAPPPPPYAPSAHRITTPPRQPRRKSRKATVDNGDVSDWDRLRADTPGLPYGAQRALYLWAALIRDLKSIQQAALRLLADVEAGVADPALMLGEGPQRSRDVDTLRAELAEELSGTAWVLSHSLACLESEIPAAGLRQAFSPAELALIDADRKRVAA